MLHIAGAESSAGSIQEMQRIVEKFPEMTKMKDTVSKHVNILHYLSTLIEQHNLLEVSELEQQVQMNRIVNARLLFCFL